MMLAVDCGLISPVLNFRTSRDDGPLASPDLANLGPILATGIHGENGENMAGTSKTGTAPKAQSGRDPHARSGPRISGISGISGRGAPPSHPGEE